MSREFTVGMLILIPVMFLLAVWLLKFISKIVPRLLAKNGATPDAVHLMGEMTFTYALVSLLQAANILCVASTSDRKVIEEENGKKTILFEFKQFRAYPKMS